MTAAGDELRADFESRTLWIFGSPRCGSTWLLGMLTEHPLVVPMNEPTLGAYLRPFDDYEPGVDVESLAFETFTQRRAMADVKSRFFSSDYQDVWLPGLRRLINDRLFAFAERNTPPDRLPDAHLVAKEPNGSQAADLIMAAQPGASLLFLLRDPRDVIDSQLASIQEGGWLQRHFAHVGGVADSERLGFVTHAAYRWLWRTQAVEAAFAAHGARKLAVRYEEMLADPRGHLASILGWMGLETEAREVGRIADQLAFERITRRGPREFFRSAKPGAWRENLRAEEQDALGRILGAKLRELGYE